MYSDDGNLANIRRPFADVVSLDGYMTPDVPDPTRFSLYADVSFGVGALGGDNEWPLTCRLALKRAEIHLFLPENEPLRLDPQGIMRSNIELATRRITTREVERAHIVGADSHIGGGLSVGVLGAGAHFKAERNDKQANQARLTTRSELEETLFTLRVQKKMSADNNHCWEVSSTDRKAMVGQAWNPHDLLAPIADTREKKTGLEPGGVRLEAKCRREDLIVSDVVVKPSHRSKVKGDIARLKEMVIEQYIKLTLERWGLDANEISNRFGVVTLSSVVAAGSFA